MSDIIQRAVESSLYTMLHVKSHFFFRNLRPFSLTVCTYFILLGCTPSSSPERKIPYVFGKHCHCPKLLLQSSVPSPLFTASHPSVCHCVRAPISRTQQTQLRRRNNRSPCLLLFIHKIFSKCFGPDWLIRHFCGSDVHGTQILLELKACYQ